MFTVAVIASIGPENQQLHNNYATLYPYQLNISTWALIWNRAI